MNKHTKLAIIIAPLLAIAGYIFSDIYVEDQAQQQRIFPLAQESSCDVLAKQCVLTSGDLKINVYDENGITYINSTFPLDSVVLFLVHSDNQSTIYHLKMDQSKYYWKINTPLRNSINQNGTKQKIRIIAQIKGGQYIGEFNTVN